MFAFQFQFELFECCLRILSPVLSLGSFVAFQTTNKLLRLVVVYLFISFPKSCFALCGVQVSTAGLTLLGAWMMNIVDGKFYDLIRFSILEQAC